MSETTLNLRGLKCPLPALRARKALTRLASGDLLVLECTDPLAEIDIPNLLRETGDALEGTRARGRGDRVPDQEGVRARRTLALKALTVSHRFTCPP